MHAATLTADTFVIGAPRPVPVLPNWLAFVGMLAFVAAVSVYDGYLVIRTGEDIRRFEKNPLGSLLIECNQGNPLLFLICKGFGTALVLAVISVLYRRSRRIAYPVASALVLFQAGLLIYLQNA
jgi:hypothetical protein